MSQHPLMPLIKIYIIATIAYLIIQISMAIANWLFQKWQEPKHLRHVENLLSANKFPRISVIYPIYNEEPEVLQSVMEHATECLSIPGLELIFVDDGSPNLADINPIYQHFEAQDTTNRLHILRETVNRGKREAMNIGFEVAKGDYIITADSDTLLETDGIIRLVAPIIADSRIGAVTGDVQVENYKDTWLTQLIALRYWVSFHVERGAQSFSGSMMVCSGPFTVYRADIIHRVRQDFISQTFLGQPCTYGDDRHLTWLVLKEGYITRIQEGAVARTMAPCTLPEYIPQQVRWTKSFIREIFWVLPNLNRISLFSIMDTLYQPIISFCFMFALANVVFMSLETLNPLLLISEIFILLLMASMRGIYGFIRTGWKEFIRFPIYGFLHVMIILPLRWKALFTMRDIGWGTRLTRKRNEVRNFLKWQAFFFLTIFTLAFIGTVVIPDEAILGFKTLLTTDLPTLVHHFVTTILQWWGYGALVASVLTPIFLIRGFLRLSTHELPANVKAKTITLETRQVHANPSRSA